jgi:hypothetical protein
MWIICFFCLDEESYMTFNYPPKVVINFSQLLIKVTRCTEGVTKRVESKMKNLMKIKNYSPDFVK